jgi:hypothetical protein
VSTLIVATGDRRGDAEQAAGLRGGNRRARFAEKAQCSRLLTAVQLTSEIDIDSRDASSDMQCNYVTK